MLPAAGMRVPKTLMRAVTPGGRVRHRGFPAGPERESRRPGTAPACYLSRPARLWIIALRPRHGHTAATHPMDAVTAAAANAIPMRHLLSPDVHRILTVERRWDADR